MHPQPNRDMKLAELEAVSSVATDVCVSILTREGGDVWVEDDTVLSCKAHLTGHLLKTLGVT